MTEAELAEIESRANAAAAGPWYARATDDDLCMNARYVGLRPIEDGVRELMHDGRQGMSTSGSESEPGNSVIAITLLQQPRMAENDQHDENTEFIAHAREDVPRLIAEVRRLRAELEIARRTGP